jgi:hypothetical protein
MAYGFYEKGQLPHPPISLSMFLVVEEALRVAWERMRTSPRQGFDFLNATEDVVTHELYECLFEDVFDRGVVAGFNAEIFRVGAREPKVRSYDRASLDKMPDLLVGFVDRQNVFMRTQDGLFIECKPVDSRHSVGLHYCDKGIVRFVRGDYAWAMTAALMIGYVRNGYTILHKLTHALGTARRTRSLRTLSFPRPCRRSRRGQNSEVVHASRHSRAFKYVETELRAPPITIRHLWLRRD